MEDQFTPLKYKRLTKVEMLQRAESHYQLMRTRRSVRHFSDEAVSKSVIDYCIRTAGTAPSGANQQPWHFSIIVDPSTKRQIRLAAEEEERSFYNGRAGDTWLETLKPLGTDASKPFLEKAPVLIAIFEQKYRIDEMGNKIKHYYAKESVGIATGMLITAIHNIGLATLTHTPSPMNFLSKILKRPEGERPFLLLVVGHPASDAKVPRIDKKIFRDITSIF